MRVAALGIGCPDPATTWRTVLDLPPVDLLVLPELCFTPWLCATPDVDPQAWERAVAGQRLELLARTGAQVVVGTMAVAEDGRRYNDAFVHTRSDGLRPVHRKTFLPDEPGFWEATWYDRGPVEFVPVDTPFGRLGISVCTEMWFTQHTYRDVDLVVVPRATPDGTTAKWLAGGATQAVCAGAFCVSSNRAETVAGTTMGGAGWVIDPDGASLAVSRPDEPVVIADIDLDLAAAAKATYPRYVSTD